MKALIVGAGPAGLLVALQLADAGWNVEMVEVLDDPRWGPREDDRTYEIVLMERGMSALKMAGIDDPDDDMATFVGSVNHNTRAGVRWGPGVLQMLSKKQRTIYGVRQEIDSMILNRIEAKGHLQSSVRIHWGYRAKHIDLAARRVVAERVAPDPAPPADASHAGPSNARSAAASEAGPLGSSPRHPSRRHSLAGSLASAVSDNDDEELGEASRATERTEFVAAAATPPKLPPKEVTLEYEVLIGADGVHSAVRESMASVPDGITASVVPGNLGYFTARCQEPRDVMIYEEVARKGLSGYDLDTAKGWIHVIPGAKPVHCDQLGYADHPSMMLLSSLRGVPLERAREAARECRVVFLGPFTWLQTLNNQAAAFEALQEQFGGRIRKSVLASIAEQIATEGGPFGGGYSVTCSRLVGPHAALVGDSAHGMLSTLGMGCNVALEGATVLAQCLGACKDVADIPGALAAYNAWWHPDALAATEMSRTFVLRKHLILPATGVLAFASRLLPSLFGTPALHRIRGTESLSQRLKPDLDRTVTDAALALATLSVPVVLLLVTFLLAVARLF